MKKRFAWLALLLLIFSCNNNKNAPDVSGIKVEIKSERFERDFFSIDSNNIPGELQRLSTKYPAFYNEYMQGILRVSGDPGDAETQQITRIMLSNYTSLYNVAEASLPDLSAQERELKKAFQFVKYYFPDYKIPGIITYIGTLDAPGTILTYHYIGIGLHQYAGKDFPGYQSEDVRQLYPVYISRRFEPEYITSNCMKAVVSDLFPDKSDRKQLIEQMIEKGKQWWLLDKFLPGTPDSLKTGFTQQQLKWCEDNEGLMWSYLIKNEDLHSVNPSTLQTYIGEAPFTSVFSQELSPGNIGQWIGWQIVKAFAEKNPKLKPEEIMKTTADKIMDLSKYKPK